MSDGWGAYFREDTVVGWIYVQCKCCAFGLSGKVLFKSGEKGNYFYNIIFYWVPTVYYEAITECLCSWDSHPWIYIYALIISQSVALSEILLCKSQIYQTEWYTGIWLVLCTTCLWRLSYILTTYWQLWCLNLQIWWCLCQLMDKSDHFITPCTCTGGGGSNLIAMII